MLIVVENLIKAYEGREALALSGVSFQVSEGECFGLLGPNGAGKTTIIGCLLGLIHPDAGKITIGNLPPTDLAVREVIGFLPERPIFEAWFSARQYLEYHHALAKQDPSTRKEDVVATLRRVGLVQDAWDRPIKKFSRGMLQRIGLAQSLVGKPKILFLDEPGSGMDPPGVTLLREILLQLKQENVTVVLNSHHLDEMERVCDRVAFINNGRIKETRSLDNVPDLPYVLKIKWLPQVAEPTADTEPKTKLESVCLDTGSNLLEVNLNTARIKVSNTDNAATVIKALVEANLTLVSASPESTSLEGMFDSEDDNGGQE
ncbi:MAG: ABC transporter ATP-binding protein [Candidatus Obscuribacterales bacterium]|nr:ABC transporter ATP-binding protein [Cyanobacteria bacterium HKST-UBA01]MCB9468270.1 ABC transporter ATP-binding protein [Candidatus Obscuribacterales bacterium]